MLPVIKSMMLTVSLMVTMPMRSIVFTASTMSTKSHAIMRIPTSRKPMSSQRGHRSSLMVVMMPSAWVSATAVLVTIAVTGLEAFPVSWR